MTGHHGFQFEISALVSKTNVVILLRAIKSLVDYASFRFCLTANKFVSGYFEKNSHGFNRGVQVK